MAAGESGNVRNWAVAAPRQRRIEYGTPKICFLDAETAGGNQKIG